MDPRRGENVSENFKSNDFDISRSRVEAGSEKTERVQRGGCVDVTW